MPRTISRTRKHRFGASTPSRRVAMLTNNSGKLIASCSMRHARRRRARLGIPLKTAIISRGDIMSNAATPASGGPLAPAMLRPSMAYGGQLSPSLRNK